MASGRAVRRPAGAVETSAKSVEEAVAQALERLGLSRDDVQIEVLHPGSPGRLLGFGAEPARVRVSPVTGAAVAVAAAAAPSAMPAVPDAENEDDGDDEEDVALPGNVRHEPARLAREGLRASDDETEGEADERIPENLEGEAEMARLMLAELLNRMEMPGLRVEVRSVDPILLDIRGDDVADLIGRRGENLRAMQFILNLMVNKQLRRHLRVTVDVDGYRARREELLRSMAQRFAYRVRSTREPMQLETMPPNERRIVHLALADDPDVLTESVGEGDNRRVVIKPKR